MRFSGLWYGVYQNVVRGETGCIMSYLTFVYISFAKIFCQNSVKKNCKYVPQVFLKKTEYVLKIIAKKSEQSHGQGYSGHGMMI